MSRFNMRNLHNIYFIAGILLMSTSALALSVGKIVYCDSSTGRYILDDGSTSAQYCTIHATMNLHKFSGCCMWHGGVSPLTTKVIIHCNDGTVSEICSLQIPHDNAVIY